MPTPPASEAAIVVETAPALPPDAAGLPLNPLLANSEPGWPLRRLASEGTATRSLNALSEDDFTGPGMAEFNGKPCTPVLLSAAAADAEFTTGFFAMVSAGAEDVLTLSLSEGLAVADPTTVFCPIGTDVGPDTGKIA